jgi:hypothetical protein
VTTAWPFVPAANFHRGRRRPARLIVVHSVEVLDSPSTAENVARFFARPSTKASAHAVQDMDSTIQCVRVGDTAWAAPNANADGLHLELAGFARSSRESWLRQDSTLTWGACVAASWYGLLRYLGAPVDLRWLGDAELRDGHQGGFVTHADVTRAFGTKGGHTDPGGGFPRAEFLARVAWWVGQFDAHGWPTPAYR